MSDHNAELVSLQNDLRHKIEFKEAYFNYGLSIASMISLVIIPLIPASLTYMSVSTRFPELLHIPVWMAHLIGILSALGVELLGLLTIRTALRMNKYNQKAEQIGMNKAPAFQGYFAAAVYIVIVLSLVVLLKIFPSLVLWALVPMSLMAFIAEWGFLLSVDQSEREMEMRLREIGEDKDSIIAGMKDEISERDKMINEMRSAISSLTSTVNTISESFSEMTVVFTATAVAVNNISERVHASEQNVTYIANKLGEHGNSIADIHAVYTSINESLNTVLDRANTTISLSVEQLSETLSQEISLMNERIDSLKAVTVKATPARRLTTERSVSRVNEQTKTKKETSIQYTDKHERQSALIAYIAENMNGQSADTLNKSELGEMFGTSRITIGRDIDELIKANRLAVNGHIEVL